ncbi:MATE family efflux transporter [Lacrimispora sp. NSJ-141]|uniref:Probable multidrug resistance protein NorM n=1 Tax=Lientehia hominis TaxID=2897778 RepID=A0AAP2W9I3_9FIRM|nr:MATE family efflux transporter [Lientehia hominis]MCD2493301.1 MATE family efflux transporter [Lientehia hominis]
MFSRKDLTRLILPLFAEQFLATTVGMADIIMVASAGEAAVSGVSLVDNISLLLINFLMAIATGGAVVCAQYLGKKKPDLARETAGQLILSTFVISLIIMVVILVGNHAILNLLCGRAEESVMANARTYFYLCAVSYPFLGVSNACAALFRVQGKSSISMLSALLMNLINIPGNALFVFVFHMGAAGVGTASLLSRIASAILLLKLIQNPKYELHLPHFTRHFQRDMVGRIMYIGIPSGLENSIFQVGKILLQSLIVSFGTASIAANAAANTLATLGTLPGSAMGLALVTVVGQCIGAGRYEEARKNTRILIGITYGAIALVCGGILLFVGPLVGIYHLSEETAKLAVTLTYIHNGFAILFWPSSFALPNALRASNDVKYTMIVSITSMWVCRIFLSYFMAGFLKMGVAGVWLAMIVDWVVRTGFFTVRFFRKKLEVRSII